MNRLSTVRLNANWGFKKNSNTKGFCHVVSIVWRTASSLRALRSTDGICKYFAILKKKTGKYLGLGMLVNIEHITYGLSMEIWYMKLNGWSWKEAGMRSHFCWQSRVSQVFWPVLPAGKFREKSVNDQLEFEYTKSGNWVGPKYFSGKGLENAYLIETWLWATNAEPLLVRQSDTEGKCGLWPQRANFKSSWWQWNMYKLTELQFLHLITWGYKETSQGSC